MPIILRRLLWLFLAGFLSLTVGAQNFSTVVVFGDSLSDTGNIAKLVQDASGPLNIRYPSFDPVLQFNYTDGRFTDGANTQPAAQAYFGVWIEQLAASFAARPAVKDARDGGTNYAYGDATTGGGTTTQSRTALGIMISIDLHNMGQQVQDYLGNVASKAAAPPNAGTLYVLWGGANDLYQASSAQTDVNAAASTAIANELALVQQLAGAGATNFLIPNLPPLGGVPDHAATPGAAALNTASAAFAQGLTQGIASLQTTLKAQGTLINVYQPDIFNLFGTFSAGPMAVGLSNITAKAQGIAGSPDTYLIWDGLHPTTTGHHFVAATAANLFRPLVASTTNLSVPAAVLAGQPITLTASVKSSTAGDTPSGLVTFFNGTTLLGSAALDATGTGMATVTPSAGTTPYSVTAVYAGDTTNRVSASAAQPLTILTAPVGTTTVLTASATSATTGSAVTLTATVTPAVTTYGAVSGTVTFLNGTASLGTATVTNGVATITTTTLPAGALSLTASYGASGTFAASLSAPLTETVTAPIIYTPTATPSTLTIASGSSGTTVLSAITLNGGGFPSSITLSCGTLPAHFACAFSSTILTFAPNGTTAASPSATLTLATNAATAALDLRRRPGAWSAPEVLSASMFLPGCLGMLLLTRRRRRVGSGSLQLSLLGIVLGSAALLGVAGGLAGCGSSSSHNAAPGSYAVPVIFTPAIGAAQTVNIAVTVR